ncbi:MAG: hypothetical protein RSC05_11935 [Acinetobacter sp.]
MDAKAISFNDYVTVQSQIVDWFNVELPKIKNFPVAYLRVQSVPPGVDDSLTVVFTPNATNYDADMVGDYVKVTFMLMYKTVTRDSSNQLYATKVLQYLLDEIQSLNINLGSDKIVLGFNGTLSPSIQSFNESEETSVYSALFELNYKQTRRF